MLKMPLQIFKALDCFRLLSFQIAKNAHLVFFKSRIPKEHTHHVEIDCREDADAFKAQYNLSKQHSSSENTKNDANQQELSTDASNLASATKEDTRVGYFQSASHGLIAWKRDTLALLVLKSSHMSLCALIILKVPKFLTAQQLHQKNLILKLRMKKDKH